jgi:hypothetical protein
MTAGRSERATGRGVRNLAAIACLVLSACAGPPAPTRWVKAGTDDATTAREVADCRAQATVAQAKQQGINQDISATLGRNWQMSNTTQLQEQTRREQAASLADQVFNNCMRAKGFTKAG